MNSVKRIGRIGHIYLRRKIGRIHTRGVISKYHGGESKDQDKSSTK